MYNIKCIMINKTKLIMCSKKSISFQPIVLSNYIENFNS